MEIGSGLGCGAIHGVTLISNFTDSNSRLDFAAVSYILTLCEKLIADEVFCQFHARIKLASL